MRVTIRTARTTPSRVIFKKPSRKISRPSTNSILRTAVKTMIGITGFMLFRINERGMPEIRYPAAAKTAESSSP